MVVVSGPEKRGALVVESPVAVIFRDLFRFVTPAMKLPHHYPSQLNLLRRAVTTSAPTFLRIRPAVLLRAFSVYPVFRTRNLNTMPPKGKEPKGKGMINLKVPKGTKDWEGKDMVIRDKIFNTITSVFKRHGAVTIDTP